MQIVPDAMGNGQRNEVDAQPQIKGIFNGIFKLDPTTFCNFGRTNRANPRKAAGHQAVIERLAMSMPPCEPR